MNDCDKVGCEDTVDREVRFAGGDERGYCRDCYNHLVETYPVRLEVL